MVQGAGMALDSPLFGSQAITSLFNVWDVLEGSEALRLSDLVFARKR